MCNCVSLILKVYRKNHLVGTYWVVRGGGGGKYNKKLRKHTNNYRTVYSIQPIQIKIELFIICSNTKSLYSSYLLY